MVTTRRAGAATTANSTEDRFVFADFKLIGALAERGPETAHRAPSCEEHAWTDGELLVIISASLEYLHAARTDAEINAEASQWLPLAPNAGGADLARNVVDDGTMHAVLPSTRFSSHGRWWVIIAAMLAMMSFVRTARAELTAADRASSDSHVREARRLVERKRFAEACAEEESPSKALFP